MASALLDVASGAEFPGAVVSVAARVVEPKAGWEERILNQPAVREAPLAGMIVGAGIGLLSELMEPLQEIDALALAGGLSGTPSGKSPMFTISGTRMRDAVSYKKRRTARLGTDGG